MRALAVVVVTILLGLPPIWVSGVPVYCVAAVPRAGGFPYVGCEAR